MTKIIGNYVLGKTLGKGKYSTVKLGIDNVTKKAFAIKIMNIQDIKKEHMELQLRREIAIMKIVQHPNIVKLNEVLQTENNIYIVMELVTGGELFERIVAEERFSEAVARRYFHQLILAIEYCHKQGIAHRDLKPENLLLDANDNLKVTDFGLSALSKNNTGKKNQLLSTTCGTPNYVAPEVIHERGYDGCISDIWSCGVILYVMLTGQLPFDSPDIETLFKKIEIGKVKYPKYLSKDATSLMSRMLTVEPSKRATIDEIKKHKWFADLVVTPRKIDAHQIEVSETQIQNAVTDSFYQVVHNPANKAQQSLNAFEIASQLIMYNLSKIASGGNTYSNRKPTQFLAKGDYETIKTKILESLQEMKASPTFKEEKSAFKCYTYGQKTSSIVSFQVLVCKTISNDLVLVEFKREKGNPLDFNQVCRNLINSLREVICSNTQLPQDMSTKSILKDVKLTTLELPESHHNMQAQKSPPKSPKRSVAPKSPKLPVLLSPKSQQPAIRPTPHSQLSTSPTALPNIFGIVRDALRFKSPTKVETR